MPKLGRAIRKAVEWGEHIDFGHKILEYALDPRNLFSMFVAVTSGLSAFFGSGVRAWEAVIIGLSILVLLLALVWGVAVAWRWLSASPQVPENGGRKPESGTPPDPIAIPAASSGPDTTIKWAFHYLCRAANLNAAKNDTMPIWRQLRQVAHDGKITVWGRPESDGLSADQFIKPVQVVPPEHWRDYDFDELHCLVGDDDTTFARTKPDNWRKHSAADGYADLRLNRDQIERMANTPVRTTRMTLAELFSKAEGELGLNFGDQSLDSSVLAKALRQAGADAAIKFFGRKLPNGLRNGVTLKNVASVEVLSLIPSDHFNEYGIEYAPILRGEENLNTHTAPISINSPFRYSDLHADRASVETWLQTDAAALIASLRRTTGP